MSLYLATRSRATQSAASIVSQSRLLSSSSTFNAALKPTLASQSGQDLLSGINFKYNQQKKKPGRKTMRLPSMARGNNPLGVGLTSSEPVVAVEVPAPPPATKYFLHVHASSNNTILHLTNAEGNSLPGGRITAGMLGFKKVQRGQFEAGFQCALRIIRRIVEEVEQTKAPPPKYRNSLLDPQPGVSHLEPKMEIEVVFTGFGMGRDALFQALMTSEGNVARPLITRLTDRTPIKIGGTRGAKTRRL